MKSNLKIGIVLAAAALFSINISRAALLSPEAAVSRVLQNPVTPAHIQTLAGTLSRTPLYTWTDSSGKATMYIFTPENQAGFILVSADDNTPPLLGYSGADATEVMRKDDAFNKFILNLKNLQEYSQQIEWARKHGVNKNNVYITPGKNAVTPMIKTKWGQRNPYYDNCPEVDGKHCLTGCTPTGLSQLMKYYNWPPKGKGSNSYLAERINRRLGLNFGNITFDWANMLNSYSSTSTELQKQAVANLAYAAGVASQVNYGTEESSASLENAAKALQDYFYYQPGIIVYLREYYSLSKWVNIIYYQLLNYGPLIYSVPGHTSVLDGYENGYLHFNWGWHGQLDGFFLPAAIICDDKEYLDMLHACNHRFAGNVVPDDGRPRQEVIPYLSAASFEIKNASSMPGQHINVSGSFSNRTFEDLNLMFGIKIINPDNYYRIIPGQDFRELKSHWNQGEFYVTVPYTTPPGIYQVFPVASIDGKNWNDIDINPANYHPVYMVVGNGRIKYFNSKDAATRYASGLPSNDPFVYTEGTPFMYSEDFRLPGGSFSPGEIIEVTGKFSNGSGTTIKTRMGFIIQDAAGNCQFVSSSTLSDLPKGYFYDKFRIRIPNTVPDGSYIVYPAFEDASGTPRLVPVANENSQNCTMTISNRRISFSK